MMSAITTSAPAHGVTALQTSGAVREANVALCVRPPQRGKLTHVPLFKDEVLLAVPRGHALAQEPYVEGCDLAEQTLVQTNATVVKAAQRGPALLWLRLATASRSGETIPAPQRRYSGDPPLCLPVSLRGRLAPEAEREGASVHRWIEGKLAG
jgi:DNA-binding transcriptional LysR family regulator